MATCNCGCGEKIGLGRRGMNKNIRRTDDLLARLEKAQEDALHFQPFPDSDPAGMREMVGDLVEKGRAIACSGSMRRTATIPVRFLRRLTSNGIGINGHGASSRLPPSSPLHRKSSAGSLSILSAAGD